MTTPTPPPGSHDDPDARVGAWLDGELSDAENEAFEAEVARDPELAARVEAVRAVRERLAGAPAEVPAGFAERVTAGIAAESDQAGAAAPPAPLSHARARRTQRRRRLVAVGSVAAALVAVAVTVPIAGDWWSQSGRDTASSADIAQDDARSFDEDGGPDMAGGDAAGAPGPAEAEDDTAGESTADGATTEQRAAAQQRSADVPVIGSNRPSFQTPRALVEHFAPRAAASELLGMAADEAERLARRSRSALRGAPAFTDGTPADACSAETTAAVDGAVVIARVQPVRLEGSPLIAHVIATGPAGRGLDALRLHVRDPAAACDAVLTRRLA